MQSFALYAPRDSLLYQLLAVLEIHRHHRTHIELTLDFRLGLPHVNLLPTI